MGEAMRDIVLVADDFGIAEGVTQGIARLARARRISGTSALVTLPRWRRDGALLADLSQHIAIGLHVNLTLGAPLGVMPSLAPSGTLPALGALVRRALLGRIDRAEVEAEIGRQVEGFRDGCGRLPDFIDGHQHVHALPGVRDALIAALQHCYGAKEMRPLVRVPSDGLPALLRRPGARGKAMTLALLAAGFARALSTAGFPANASFAGVTTFADDENDVRHDIAAAARASRGGLHLVMCHPGVPDAELAGLDPITTRRAAELAVLGADNVLTRRLLHPRRTSPGDAIDWRQMGAVMR